MKNLFKKRVKSTWNFGDIFAAPLLNGEFGTGQVLDLQDDQIVRVLLFDTKFKYLDQQNKLRLTRDNIISALSIGRQYLDKRIWIIIGHEPVLIPINEYPNQQYKGKDWVGAVYHSAPVANSLLNAYFGLKPWDDYFDPNYLDSLLFDGVKRPDNIVLVKN
jgi:hypothetical protein